MRRMKVWLGLGCAALVALAVSFPYWRTPAAEMLWTRYGSASLAVLLDSKDANLAFTIGNDEYGVSHYDPPLAERAFRKSVAIDPVLFWGHYQLARVLFVEGRLPEALAQINAELTAHPENSRSLYVRGLVEAYSGDLTDAASDFSRFTQWAPTEWAGYNDLAWTLGQEGKYQEAEQALKKGISDAAGGTQNPWLWDNLGVQQMNQSAYAEALRSLEKAKEFAANLTDESWHEAYPGNDPGTSNSGLQSFRAAIDTNIARVTTLLSLMR